MKKKVLLFILLVIGALTITGCGKKEEPEKEEPRAAAVAFKEEYESLNGKEIKDGIVHRTVTIDEYNPFVKVTPSELLEKIDNKETFYVYFGDKLCPWCRSVIEKAIEVAKSKNIDTIYYVNIWDDEYNEILRDKYTLGKKDKPVKSIEGTEEYKRFLEIFDNVLSDYTLTTSKGKAVSTGEKRIYAPNYFKIVKGEAKLMVSGKSEKQTDAREKLTDEMLEDEIKEFEKLFK